MNTEEIHALLWSLRELYGEYMRDFSASKNGFERYLNQLLITQTLFRYDELLWSLRALKGVTVTPKEEPDESE